MRDKNECLTDKKNAWVNQKYNFDDLGKALMSLFVLSSRDGWVNIMYTGLDAVGVDQQVYLILINGFYYAVDIVEMPKILFINLIYFTLSSRSADRKLFRMATVILHIVYTSGRIFRTKHVRWRGSRKLP